MSRKRKQIPTAHKLQILFCDRPRMTNRCREKELTNTPSVSASDLLPVSNCQKVIVKYQYFLPQGSSGERDCSISSSSEMSLGEDKGPESLESIDIPAFPKISTSFDVDLLV